MLREDRNPDGMKQLPFPDDPRFRPVIEGGPSPAAMEKARGLAPGYDPYAILSDWIAWRRDKSVPRCRMRRFSASPGNGRPCGQSSADTGAEHRSAISAKPDQRRVLREGDEKRRQNARSVISFPTGIDPYLRITG